MVVESVAGVGFRTTVPGTGGLPHEDVTGEPTQVWRVLVCVCVRFGDERNAKGIGQRSKFRNVWHTDRC